MVSMYAEMKSDDGLFVFFYLPGPLSDFLVVFSWTATFLLEMFFFMFMRWLDTLVLNLMGVFIFALIVFLWHFMWLLASGLASRFLAVVDFLTFGLFDLSSQFLDLSSRAVAFGYRALRFVIRYSTLNLTWLVIKTATALAWLAVQSTGVLVSCAINFTSALLWFWVSGVIFEPFLVVVDFYRYAFLDSSFFLRASFDGQNIVDTVIDGTLGSVAGHRQHVFSAGSRLLVALIPVFSWTKICAVRAELYGFRYTVGLELRTGNFSCYPLVLSVVLLTLSRWVPRDTVVSRTFFPPGTYDDKPFRPAGPGGPLCPVGKHEKRRADALARGTVLAAVEGVDLVSMSGALSGVPRLRPRSRVVARLQRSLGGMKGVVGALVHGRLEAFKADLPAGDRSPTMNAVLATVGKGKKVLGVGTFPAEHASDGDYIILEDEGGSRTLVIPSLHSRLVSYAAFRQRNEDLVLGLKSRAWTWFKETDCPSWVPLLALSSSVALAFAPSEEELKARATMDAAMVPLNLGTFSPQ